MNKPTIRTLLTGGIAALAVAGAVAVSVPAAASAAGQAVVSQSSSARGGGDGTAACDRLKKNQDQRNARLTRLQADESTRGSIKWLTARAAAAAAAGNNERATLDTDRAALRSAILGPLQTVKADADALIAAKCG